MSVNIYYSQMDCLIYDFNASPHVLLFSSLDCDCWRREWKWDGEVGRGDCLCLIPFHASLNHFMYFTGKKASLYNQSNPDWAPSLKMTPVTNVEKVEMRSESAVKRYHRARGLEEKRERRSAAQGLVALFSTDPVDVSEPTLHPEGKVCRMFLRGPLEPVTTVRETEPVIVGQMQKEVQTDG